MTQPPSPADPPPPDEQPTVAWTPTESPEPAEAAAPAEPASPADPSAPSTPASPIISAAPLAGAAGASGAPFASADPAAPGAIPTGEPPLVAWTPPGPAAAAVANRDGFVLSGVIARLVAYFIDGVLVSIIPTLIGVILNDQSTTVGGVQVNGSGVAVPAAATVTLQRVLLEFIGLGINFLYFVGLWTSGWRATVGQRLLAIQVVDTASGEGLDLAAASKRWLAFGAPLALLSLVPGLASLSSLLSLGLVLLLLVTTITNPRRQGLQDRFAGSLVIRRATSGDGAVLVGCLILVLLLVAIGILFSAFAIASLGPDYWDRLFEEIGNSI